MFLPMMVLTAEVAKLDTSQSLEGYLPFFTPTEVCSPILRQGLEEWIIFVRESADEPVEGYEMSIQHLDLLHASE